MQFHGSSAALIPHTLSADFGRWRHSARLLILICHSTFNDFGSNYEASVRIADLCAKIVSACSPSSKDQVCA
jgi:hypothetical protein